MIIKSCNLHQVSFIQARICKSHDPLATFVEVFLCLFLNLSFPKTIN